MSTIISEVINSQSFGVLIERVNQLAATITSNVVTTAHHDVGAIDGIGQTIGNAFVQGILGSNIIYATTVAGGNISSNTILTIASNTQITWTNDTGVTSGYLSIGNNTVNSTFTVNGTANTIASFNGSVNSAFKVIIKNSNTSSAPSADFEAYNDVNKRIRVGIKGSDYYESDWTINRANSANPGGGYLYSNTSLSVGVTDSNSCISFFVGGGLAENEILTIANSGNVGINTTTPDANFSVYGTANISGAVAIGGYTTIRNSINVASIDSNLLPTTNNYWTLGNIGHRFSTLYVSGTPGIVLGNVTVTEHSDNKSVRVPNLRVNHDSVVVGNSSVWDNFNVTNAVNFANTLDVVNSVSFSNTLLVTGNTRFNNTMVVVGATSLGNTLSVVNAVTFANTLLVTGNTRFNNTMVVVGATSLGNTLSVVNSVSFSNTLDVTGATVIHNTLDVDGAATLSDTLEVTGVTTIHNNVIVDGNMNIANNINVTNAATFSNSMYVAGFVGMGNTLSVSGAVTLANTLNTTGAAEFANSVYVIGETSIESTLYALSNLEVYQHLSVTNTVSFSNSLAVIGSTTFGNTLNVTGSVEFDDTLYVYGETRVQDSTLWVRSDSGNIIKVGNNSTNSVINSTSISIANVFATNIAGLITTVDQTQITANNSLNLDGQRGQYYIDLAETAYNNAVTYATSIAAIQSYTNSVSYTNLKTAETLTLAQNYALLKIAESDIAFTEYAANATNITTGTLPSGRLVGSYSGITNVGTLSANLNVANSVNSKYLEISNSASFGNSITVNGGVSLTGNSTVSGNSNISRNLWVGGNFTLLGDSTITGSTSQAGNFVPTNNNYIIGDIDKRFTFYGMGGSFVRPLTVSNTVSFGNTYPEIDGRLLGNSTLRWTLSANTIDVSNSISTANLAVLGNSVLQKTTITTANVYGVFTAHGNSSVYGNSSVDGILTVSNSASFGNTTINGFAKLNNSQIYSNTIVFTASLGLQTIDFFSSSSFRSAEYVIQVSNTTYTQVSKLLLFHNGGDSYITEYAQLSNPGIIGTFSTDINTGNVRLRINPITNIGTSTITFVRTLIQ